MGCRDPNIDGMTKKTPILFLKASIPAGARWLTVHPNGEGSKGQPVLVQPAPGGGMHVIGGAGGSLNYLKLKNVKSESTYKQEAADAKEAKKAAAKEQREKDKQAGLLDSKKKAHEALRAQKLDHEKKFIGTVGSAMGWNKKDTEFDEEAHAGLSKGAREKARQAHHRMVLKKAHDAVGLQRQMLVNDPIMRADAGIGEIPLLSQNPDTLSVEDLAPVKQANGGLGFAADYKGRSQAAGLDEKQLKTEADAVRAEKLGNMTDAQRQAAVQRGETSKMISEELKNIREPAGPDLSASLADAKTAVDLLKAQKELQQVLKKARTEKGAIDKSDVEPKAYVLAYTDDPGADAAVAKDIDGDLRTVQTRAFLSEFQKLAGEDPTETLGKHIGVGAYNSVNSLALAVGGDALVDRSVVDVLGIAGAAQVLARRIHTDLPPEEVEKIAQGVEDFHMEHYMAASREALDQARELTDAAKAIEIGDAADGAELAVAQEMNDRRRKAVVGAQKILGQTLGEMEANAAISMALKQGKKDTFQVSLGKTQIPQAIQQARAIGLQRGDYKIESVAGNTFLSLNGDGLDRLAKPINRDDVEQVKRNLSIIRGDQDEDGWLPLGVANRPDLVMDVKAGVAPRLAQPFEPGADLQQSLRDYIGGRAADGDAPGDIVADIQSADFFNKVGVHRADDYRAALDAVAPLKGQDGKMQRADDLAASFDKYADESVQRRYGETMSPLNKQKIKVDQKSVDALHRALAETPEGTAAYKQIGELTHGDQRALREFFQRNVAKESPEAAKLRADLDQHLQSEPEKQTQDMFGETVENPAHTDWKSSRDSMTAKVNGASLNWSKYVETMGGNERAYESVQDLIRSKVAKTFVGAYNKLHADAPIKIGTASIRNNLNHLDATDPKARDERIAKERELVDGLRERVGRKYAGGSVKDKMQAAREQRDAFEGSQMGFFADETPLQDQKARELGGDERNTLGHQAERQIAGMMDVVGKNFKPGKPTKMWNVSMSGKFANQQRAIKMLAQNKRIGLAFGAGSGKTNIMLGAHAHLSGLGKVKRSIMLVPSVVQGQFAGEALRLLEPGKFKWHIEPGASQESRIAAYKDPETHIAVMTHQSFRGDMIHLGAKAAGVDEAVMAQQLSAMTAGDRKAWIKGVMDKEGINFDASFVDEAHETLNRVGKENSSLANVTDALSSNTPYYAYASGESGVKNDTSEIYSMMEKLDPERYSDRAAFMRRYGADTLASKDALKREMARYVFPASITPDVQKEHRRETVDLTAGQKSAMDALSQNIAKVRLARMQGKVDIDAMKAISPNSFDGVADDQIEAVAKNLQNSIGIMKASAVQRIINSHPDNAKINRMSQLVAERKGKQGVVFAHGRADVEAITKRLTAEGKRVVTITGSDSAEDKDRKRKLFNPEKGEAQADILVASDAGAVGMNLQSGQYLIQHDIPNTAKTHAQRNARIDRIGQKNNIELIDMQANHPEESRARERLTTKYGLRDMMTSSMDGLDDTGVAYHIAKQRAINKDSQNSLF